MLFFRGTIFFLVCMHSNVFHTIANICFYTVVSHHNHCVDKIIPSLCLCLFALNTLRSCVLVCIQMFSTVWLVCMWASLVKCCMCCTLCNCVWIQMWIVNVLLKYCVQAVQFCCVRAACCVQACCQLCSLVVCMWGKPVRRRPLALQGPHSPHPRTRHRQPRSTKWEYHKIGISLIWI